MRVARICNPSTACAPNPPVANANRVMQLSVDTALRLPVPCPVAKKRRRHRR